MLTIDRLKDVLHYSSETGDFRWKQRKGIRPSAGTLAGSIDRNGYLLITIDQQKYSAHRLAWFYIHETWPFDMLDHIDGVRTNNKISNLREANAAQNQQNIRVAKKNSKTGFLGVYASRNRFKAQIRIDGKCICLGMFDTPEEAHAAYLCAKRQYHHASTI